MNGSCKCRLPSPQKFSLKFLLFPTQRSLVLAGATYAWPTSPISDLGTRFSLCSLLLSNITKSQFCYKKAKLGLVFDRKWTVRASLAGRWKEQSYLLKNVTRESEYDFSYVHECIYLFLGCAKTGPSFCCRCLQFRGKEHICNLEESNVLGPWSGYYL